MQTHALVDVIKNSKVSSRSDSKSESGLHYQGKKPKSDVKMVRQCKKSGKQSKSDSKASMEQLSKSQKNVRKSITKGNVSKCSKRTSLKQKETGTSHQSKPCQTSMEPK